MIIVVDGNNLGHRSFHTPQGSLTTKDGTPSGVMLGVLNSIKGIIEKFPETTKVVVCWDGGKSKWRKSLYPEYKGQRDYGKDDPEKKKAYEGLWSQMNELHTMLNLIGVHSIKIDGEEADDIIARICQNTDKHVMIVTSDKDMLQLVSDDVSVYSPFKDKIISPLNFYEETGVTIESYIGYRALVGDSSDNIIGIDGIGDKTAKNLMDKYGHIDNILGATGDVKKILLKSKRTARIFEPEGLRRLGINNKIMSFKHIPDLPEVSEAVNRTLLEELDINGKEFKQWLTKWQFLSILTNYISWISPFMALGEE